MKRYKNQAIQISRNKDQMPFHSHNCSDPSSGCPNMTGTSMASFSQKDYIAPCKPQIGATKNTTDLIISPYTN